MHSIGALTASVVSAVVAVSGTVSAIPPSGARASVLAPSVERAFSGAGRASEADPAIKVWVYFRDKGVVGDAVRAAVDAVASTADAHQLERRQRRRTDAGLFDERDVPVSAAYVAEVRTSGAKVHVESRWLNAVSVWATREQVARIVAMRHVAKVESVRGGRRHEAVVSDPIESGGGAPSPRGVAIEGIAFDQQNQMGLTALHAAGFTGAGVRIGILDTGFKRAHAVFNQPGHPLVVIAEHDFIFNDGNTANEPDDDPSQHNHGTYCLGLIGAFQPSVYCGGAYDASFILCKTEDVRSETPIEEDNFVAGLEFIEMHGGDIATASLGYIDWYTQADLDGQTAVTTIAVNVATSNGLICFNAAGNEGNDGNPATSHLIAPADARKVLTIGAVESSGASAGFTSDGPAADGRLKPEVLARGVNNDIIRAGNDTDFTNGSGTSFATPLVAAAGACLLQAHPTWTVDQMRAYLCSSATDFVVTGTHDPLFVRGFGIVNAIAASGQDCNRNGVNDATEIAVGMVADCNENGVPDSCDVDLGPLALFSADVDVNGVPDECPSCPADINGDGAVTSQDFFNFIAAFFSMNADFNHDGLTTSQDFFDFLAAFFTPC